MRVVRGTAFELVRDLARLYIDAKEAGCVILQLIDARRVRHLPREYAVELEAELCAQLDEQGFFQMGITTYEHVLECATECWANRPARPTAVFCGAASVVN